MTNAKEVFLNIDGEWEKADTSSPEWERYYADLKAHKEFMKLRQPRVLDFQTLADYQNAYSRWQFDSAMSAPNKPGYYRANND